MNNLRRLIRTTLIGGVLFLIPLVFVAVVFGKAFQIMKVVATPLRTLIPIESLAGFAIVEILTAFIMILSCLFAGMLARSPWGQLVNQKLDAVLLQMIHKPERELDDRKSRVGKAAGREHAAAGDVEIFQAVHAAVLVDHAVPRVLSHAGRAHVVASALKPAPFRVTVVEPIVGVLVP